LYIKKDYDFTQAPKSSLRSKWVYMCVYMYINFLNENLVNRKYCRRFLNCYILQQCAVYTRSCVIIVYLYWFTNVWFSNQQIQKFAMVSRFRPTVEKTMFMRFDYHPMLSTHRRIGSTFQRSAVSVFTFCRGLFLLRLRKVVRLDFLKNFFFRTNSLDRSSSTAPPTSR